MSSKPKLSLFLVLLIAAGVIGGAFALSSSFAGTSVGQAPATTSSITSTSSTTSKNTTSVAPTPGVTQAPTATLLPEPTTVPAATPVPLPSPTSTPSFPSFTDRFSFKSSDVVKYLKPGVIHVQRVATGPVHLNILLFDLTSPELNIKVALQGDTLSGVARTSVLAKEFNALAAVNGDLFSASGLPQGMTMTDGKLAISPKRRATFAYSKQTGPYIGYFTQNFTWDSYVAAQSGERYKLEVLNSSCREVNWLCIYNEMYSFVRANVTATPDTRVLLNEYNEVVSIKQSAYVEIPTGFNLLLGQGRAAKWLQENAKLGQKLDPRLVTDPDFRQFDQIISGGPVFMRRGEFIQDCMCYLEDCTDSAVKNVLCEEFTTEWKESHYYSVRMPRNGVGFTSDKSVLIVAVADGYQAGYSIGVTQREFYNLFKEFGAESAMELDGGGSATMVVNGKLASRPSDGGGQVERWVPNALVFQWKDDATGVNAGNNSLTPGTGGSKATVTAGGTGTPRAGTPSATRTTSPAGTSTPKPTQPLVVVAPTPTNDPFSGLTIIPGSRETPTPAATAEPSPTRRPR